MGWLNWLPRSKVVRTSLLIAGITLVTAVGLTYRQRKNKKGEKQDVRNKKHDDRQEEVTNEEPDDRQEEVINEEPDDRQEEVAVKKYCYKNLQNDMPPTTKQELNGISLQSRDFTFEPTQVDILLRLIEEGRFNDKLVVYDRYIAEDLLGEPGPEPNSWLVDRQLYKWDEMRIRCENLIERMYTDDDFQVRVTYELLEHTITHAQYHFDRRYDELMEMRLMEEGNNYQADY